MTSHTYSQSCLCFGIIISLNTLSNATIAYSHQRSYSLTMVATEYYTHSLKELLSLTTNHHMLALAFYNFSQKAGIGSPKDFYLVVT